MNTNYPVLEREPIELADQLTRLESKVDRLLHAVELIDRKREELEDLVQDLMPGVNGAIEVAGRRLDQLERSGVTAFARESLRAAEQVATTVDPQAIRALANRADNLVTIARALSAPEIVALATRASTALADARKGAPPNWLALLRARKEPRVRRGIGVLLELLRAMGTRVTDRGSGIGDHGSGISVKRSIVSQSSIPDPRSTVRATSAHTHCDVPAAPTPVAQTREIGGRMVQLDAEEFLVDRAQWTREVAQGIAAGSGIAELTTQHWSIIDFCRQDAGQNGASPGMRRITKQLGISAKELYALFPKGPGILAARIAGLPKPKSCV